jgi:hypothetical protein
LLHIHFPSGAAGVSMASLSFAALSALRVLHQIRSMKNCVIPSVNGSL